jgi:hypothetical protein
MGMLSNKHSIVVAIPDRRRHGSRLTDPTVDLIIKANERLFFKDALT